MLTEHFHILPLDFGNVQHGVVVDGVAGERDEVVGEEIKGQANNRFPAIVQKDLAKSQIECTPYLGIKGYAPATKVEPTDVL